MYVRKNLKSDKGYETDIILENENGNYNKLHVFKHLVYIPEKNLLHIMRENKISIKEYFYKTPIVGDFIKLFLMENSNDDSEELDFYPFDSEEYFPLYHGRYKNEIVSEFGYITNVNDTEVEFEKYKLEQSDKDGNLIYVKH